MPNVKRLEQLVVVVGRLIVARREVAVVNIFRKADAVRIVESQKIRLTIPGPLPDLDAAVVLDVERAQLRQPAANRTGPRTAVLPPNQRVLFGISLALGEPIINRLVVPDVEVVGEEFEVRLLGQKREVRDFVGMDGRLA